MRLVNRLDLEGHRLHLLVLVLLVLAVCMLLAALYHRVTRGESLTRPAGDSTTPGCMRTTLCLTATLPEFGSQTRGMQGKL